MLGQIANLKEEKPFKSYKEQADRAKEEFGRKMAFFTMPWPSGAALRFVFRCSSDILIPSALDASMVGLADPTPHKNEKELQMHVCVRVCACV